MTLLTGARLLFEGLWCFSNAFWVCSPIGDSHSGLLVSSRTTFLTHLCFLSYRDLQLQEDFFFVFWQFVASKFSRSVLTLRLLMSYIYIYMYIYIYIYIWSAYS